MSKPNVELKATSFTLSVLYINHPSIDVVSQELDKKLAQAPQFFLGAPLILNLSAINQSEIDIAELKQCLSDKQLIIVGITDANDALAKQAKNCGLAVVKSGKQAPQPQLPKRDTKIVKQNVRSGQQIYAKDSDLVVFGAVGNGAEVIADGSIHIYGALRGKAMAGAGGDNNSIIIASQLQAELVSIAGQYWLAEHLQQYQIEKRGCVRLSGDTLLVESLPE
ncbi:septum site-determining protein MinC [Shewanella intestini]|uniref:Probable septum site-determining protein MinC n=1 Tax=Shewanella intestini TaxID=2017544 RepID=A0ABS5HZ80_9GAMM|nr:MULTISPECIES: septum site-determining protein MinC [Shewanella]MBR9727095.1 septum site-determining protein MinC [Shewanella intestini]MRG35897.1 septum site-determining protein MinC [Shewanella sp. XMDDZSB0408]